MSNTTDLSDLVICIEKYVERKINKVINDYKKTPSRENCVQFYRDLSICIDNYKNNETRYIQGTIWNNLEKPTYFDFTKCPQYKNLDRFEQIKLIKYNIYEISRPDNKFYEIKFEKGDLEINLKK